MPLRGMARTAAQLGFDAALDKDRSRVIKRSRFGVRMTFDRSLLQIAQSFLVKTLCGGRTPSVPLQVANRFV